MHVVGQYVREAAPGERLFEGITAREALSKLRFMLAAIGVENSDKYRSHDIRRGHALDLQCSGTIENYLDHVGQFVLDRCSTLGNS